MTGSNSEMALREAIAHHRAGRLQQAETMYREILSKDQNCASALHMLGAIAYQVGRYDEGLNLIQRAIELGLTTPEAYNNLGECLRCMKRIKEAALAYRDAIKMNPKHGEALSNLGMLLNDARQYKDALPFLENAVKHRPDIANARYNYGVTLANLNKLDEAIKQWEGALKLQPDHLLALKNLGLAFREMERFEESVKILQTLVEKHPKFAEGYADLAKSLASAGKFEDAIAQGKRAIELAPDRPEAHNALAMVLAEAKQYTPAIQAAKHALRIRPNFCPAMMTLGWIHRQLDQNVDAALWYERAWEVDPMNTDAQLWLFDVYYQLKEPEKALQAAERALAKNPQDSNLHFNRSIALLVLGRYVEGFEEYEFRSTCKNFNSILRKLDKPMWDGSSPNGRTILVHVEQGFGDMFQFARFVPKVAEIGFKVVLEVPWEIQSLMNSLPGISKVIERKRIQDIPPFDVHIPLVSICRVMKTTLENIPQEVPYLQPHAANIQRWKPKVESEGRGLKVGLVWGGNVIPDPRRSCPLKELAVLGDVQNVSWFSLQVGEPRDQLKDVQMNIVDLGKDFKDFGDTAAVLSQLDLLVTIDTAAAHLAGALGLKTWVLVPFVPDWRWLMEGDTTAWYPTMRLFRQKLRGDWSIPIREIRDELTALSLVPV